jgi:hypothetical protein
MASERRVSFEIQPDGSFSVTTPDICVQIAPYAPFLGSAYAMRVAGDVAPGWSCYLKV